MSGIQIQRERKKGFTLLFAVLTASLILAISISILTISIKESRLSGIARESQLAFYAADAGVECVLYWDIVWDAFNLDPETQSIMCVGQTNVVGSASGFSNFTLTFPGKDYCVNIEVERRAGPTTVIRSRGNNTCDVNSPRRVERAIIVNY